MREGHGVWRAVLLPALLLAVAATAGPPGVRVIDDGGEVTVEVRLDPAAVSADSVHIGLRGWSCGPGLSAPPLPRTDLMLPLEMGTILRIEGIAVSGEEVVLVGDLGAGGEDPATPPPPGVPWEAWRRLLREERVLRWRSAPEHSVARLLKPVCRGERCFARLRLEPLAWDPETGTVTVFSRISVALRRIADGATGNRTLVPPDPPYRGADPGFPPVALTVRDREGILHLEWSELTTLLGWNAGAVDSSRIQVWEDGEQVAIDVSDGRWVELFVRPRTGENVAGEYRKGDWTDDRVFWFIVGDGSIASRRIGVRDVTPASAPLLAEYPFSVRLRDETDCRYFSAHVPSVDDEVFHWRTASWSEFYTPPQVLDRLPLDLPGLAGSSVTPIALSVRLLGAASLAALSPQHRQLFELRDGSGQTIVQITDPSFDFDGDTVHEDVFTLDTADVEASDGILYATAADPSDRCVGGCPAVSWDIAYVDWIDATYPREPVAVDGACPVTPGSAGVFRIRVTGLGATSAADVRAWDVTDPRSPVRLTGWDWNAGTAELEDTASEGSRYLVADETGWVRVTAADFRPATVHDWASGPAGGADWVAIGPRALLSTAAVTDLEAVRRASGLRTAVVPVEEVYDEFSHGVPTPWAIRSFVAWAVANWDGAAPSRFLLVGDGTFDTKNQGRPCAENCHDSDPDNDVFEPADNPAEPMPTWLEVVPGDTTGLGVLASDGWFGCADGDAMPDVTVGRLPARDAASLRRMVDRILAVGGTAPGSGPWTTRLEYVAGATDAPALEPVLDDLEAALPAAFDREKLYFARAPWNGATADADSNGISDMVDAINAGRVLVEWLGHSGFGALMATGSATALETADLASPGANLSENTALLAAGACYVGAFDHFTAQPTLGEALVGAEEGGAAAVMAHSTSSWVWAADEMLEGIQETLTGMDARSTAVGDAWQEAVVRLLGAGHDVEAASLVLLGDPGMRLPVPDPEAPGAPWVADQRCSRLWLSWAPSPDAVSYTLYRSAGGAAWEPVLEGVTAVPVEDPLTPPGATVSYRVTAVDGAGFESGGSGVLTVTVPGGGATVGDIDCSCSLEAADLAAWIAGWYGGVDPCGTADVDGNGTVSTADLDALARVFF